MIERDGLRATVVLGEFEGAVSPATTYSPIVGVELVFDGEVTIELNPAYEYGVLAIDAGVVVEDQRLEPSDIAYVGGARPRCGCAARTGRTRAFLLGGEPFDEELVMWWNFIGRTHEEIEEFRAAWNDGPSEPDLISTSGRRP